ncbi:MAG: four-carbon acid sugar kinase family protein [Gemmatimonadota bacterium]
MIAVVADDFTGAAEIGAIGCRYGLRAEVQTAFRPTGETDLVVIDTHTRSSSSTMAAQRVGEEMERLREAGIEWVYKKVDSVLRGHVVAELSSALDRSGLRRALLVPANPSFGQVIRQGHYRIDGHPLNETRFALDPEHPAWTDDVLDLLGRMDGVEVAYSEDWGNLPETGIVVAGVDARHDLVELAGHLDARTLAAGGAEFFAAALARRLGRDGREAARDVGPRPPKALFVLGSRSEHGRALLARARMNGARTVLLEAAAGEGRTDGEPIVDPWVEAALDGLRAGDVVVVAVDPDGMNPSLPLPVHRLPRRLACIAEAVLRSWPGNDLHLFVEGGTTASTIVRQLGWKRLRVVGELESGVVTLAAVGGEERLLTVKPGNYAWPESLLGWFR